MGTMEFGCCADEALKAGSCPKSPPPGDRAEPPRGTVADDRDRPSYIPLRMAPGTPPPFGPQDIVLEDGDIVFLKLRDEEVFLTGGLLPGRVMSLPRDYNLTVVEAVGLSFAAAAGPAGQFGRSLNWREGELGGIINPTRLLVVRQLPGGEQVKISIDLNATAGRSAANMLVQPNDLIMLEFKPSEYAANFVLSLIRSSITYSNVDAQCNAVNNSNTIGTGTTPGGGEIGGGGGGPVGGEPGGGGGGP